MTRRLRVVHVTGGLDLGGQEKLLVEFARHANRHRFELRFLSLTTRGVLADELEALDCPVSTLEISSGFYPRLPWTMSKLFREWDVDIIHTHNERPLIYASFAALLTRACCVIHTKHGRGVGNSRRQRFMTSLAAKFADYFVCVSQDCARLAAHERIPEKSIRTIPNGIDTRQWPAMTPQLAGPAVIVARLNPEKDHATLLNAVAQVVREAPEFRLVVAGDGPCLPQLQQLARSLQITQHVHFLGAVRDVPTLLRQARMKVLSSVSEGMSLTLLEAMATGLPIVATTVGGNPEVVQHELTGLLVAPGNPEALAAALLRLQRDDALVTRLGQAGRHRAEEQFDIRQMMARYEAMYLSSIPDRLKEKRHDVHPAHPAGVGDRGGRRPRMVA
jgi:glycosyltransferase involved in cell wall biosynthesis